MPDNPEPMARLVAELRGRRILALSAAVNAPIAETTVGVLRM